MTFRYLEDMIPSLAETAKPAERLTVSQSATRRWLNNPGSYVGYWQNEKTPYLVEPMDEMTSLDYTAVIIAGPARSGKTDLFFNWLSHSAITDPADMMLVHMTQASARDWSQGDLNKNFFLEGDKRRPTELGKRLVPGRQNDNVHDKKFTSGMRLLVKWPTITELSGKTIPRLWLNDYDRMTQNVDGEGNPFDLTRKRAQTFKRYGMCVAEASPGFLVTDGKWTPPLDAPHEAPPTEGILALYNRGDRRRWYWRCPQCKSAFEPDFKLLIWPNSKDHVEAAEQCEMICPHDGFPMKPSMQYELNLGGKWVKEGQHWLEDGSIVGDPRRSDIASFWLKGPAAAFTDWPGLVLKYLMAQEEYTKTFSEEALKTTTNTDQGLPYIPKNIEAGRLPDQLRERAKPWSKRGEIPEGGRFAVTTIDVQAGARPCFVVHTYAIGVGGDIWHVDMRKIRKSKRTDEDGHPELIDPAAYPEDWDILIEEVIEKEFPLADGSGRKMRAKIIACDSGGAGAAGNTKVPGAKKKKDSLGGEPVVSVTSNAYDFWRRLKSDPLARNHHLRFHLVKGAPSKSAPRLHKSLPDSQQRDKYAIARGDVPVWLINSNMIKDMANNRLGRTEPGGRINFPLWYQESGEQEDIGWLYQQLTTEVQTAAGWINPSRRKNEAWDLLCYCIAILLHPDIRIEFLDWLHPPDWADEWNRNPLVTAADVNPFEMEEVEDDEMSIEELARSLS